MSWFIIDDHMAEHPTIRRLGLAALGLWVRMGSYVGMYADDDNYDGVFTLDDIKAYKGTKKLADSLVDAGLWEQVDGGYRIVYVDNICIKPRAKTKAENAELSEKRAESGRKGGKAKAANASKTAGKTSSKTSSKTAGKNLANDESEVWQNPSKTEPYTYTYTDTYTDMKPTHIPPDAEQATTPTDAGTHDDPTTDAGPADAGEPADADTTSPENPPTPTRRPRNRTTTETRTTASPPHGTPTHATTAADARHDASGETSPKATNRPSAASA